jgi:hypothetical protein
MPLYETRTHLKNERGSRKVVEGITNRYSEWVANIVLVPNNDKKVQMCIDYIDLNRASPKDNFPLTYIVSLLVNTTANVVFSFIDGFSWYN